MDREGLISPPGPPRIRVYRVIARLNVGGPAQHVVALSEHLDPGIVESRLFAGALSHGEGDLSGLAEQANVDLEFVPGLSAGAGVGGDLRALWWLYRRFRRDRPMVVHTHTAKAGAVGRVAAALAGVPVRVHTFHGHVLGGMYFSPRRTTFYRFTERVLARLTDRLVAVSDGQADELANDHGIAPRDRFVTVRLGLDLRPFVDVQREEARRRVRSELGIDLQDPVITIVGRVVSIKNHELLLRSLPLLRVRPPPRIVVVGDGRPEFVADLQALAEHVGVRERVLWLGWRRDMPALLAASDVLAVPSHDEGTPVAIIEALATGTPVVARSVGGIPEMLEDQATSRLARSGRPRDFASALGAVLEAKAVDEEDRNRARRVAQRRYSRERMAREVERIYLEEVERTFAEQHPSDVASTVLGP